MSCAALHDPFEGLSGWHTGLNEVRGGGPTTLFDVHCPCLNFAVSESQVQLLTEIQERADRAERVLEQALAKTREAAAQRRAQRSKEMANVKAPKLTREGIKEMLEKASKQADMREKIRLRGIRRKRRLRMDGGAEVGLSDQAARLTREADSGAEITTAGALPGGARPGGGDQDAHAVAEGEIVDNSRGMIGNVLSWAWSSIVGEDGETDDGGTGDYGGSQPQLSAESSTSRCSASTSDGTNHVALRTFSVVGVRLDHVGLDLLLHVHGPMRSNVGPMHSRFGNIRASISSEATDPLREQRETAISSANSDDASVDANADANTDAPESETRTPNINVPKSNRNQRHAAASNASFEHEVSRSNSLLHEDESFGGRGLLGIDLSDPNTIGESTRARHSNVAASMSEHDVTSSGTSMKKNIVKVRTPGGYVEVDMGDRESAQSSLSSSYSTEYSGSGISRRVGHGDNALSGFASAGTRGSHMLGRGSSPRSTSSSLAGSSPIDGFTGNSTLIVIDGSPVKREHIEAFACLHFAGVEIETRSHTLSYYATDLDAGLAVEDGDSDPSNENNLPGTSSYAADESFSHGDTVDKTVLLDVRSVGCWGLPNTVRSLLFANAIGTDQTTMQSGYGENRTATLPQYFFLWGRVHCTIAKERELVRPPLAPGAWRDDHLHYPQDLCLRQHLPHLMRLQHHLFSRHQKEGVTRLSHHLLQYLPSHHLYLRLCLSRCRHRCRDN